MFPRTVNAAKKQNLAWHGSPSGLHLGWIAPAQTRMPRLLLTPDKFVRTKLRAMAVSLVPLDNRAAVREEGKFVRITPELKDEVVMFDLTVRFQAQGHLREVHRSVPFVDLHRISAAERESGAGVRRPDGENCR